MKRSQECAPCPAGEYCAGYGLKEPTGPCDAGFYCSGRACTSVSIQTGLAWVVLYFILNNYSTSAHWIWQIVNKVHSANHLVSNKRQWNNYSIKKCPLKYRKLEQNKNNNARPKIAYAYRIGGAWYNDFYNPSTILAGARLV